MCFAECDLEWLEGGLYSNNAPMIMTRKKLEIWFHLLGWKSCYASMLIYLFIFSSNIVPRTQSNLTATSLSNSLPSKARREQKWMNAGQ